MGNLLCQRVTRSLLPTSPHDATPCPSSTQRILDEFVARLSVWPWDQDAVAHYGYIRRHLKQKGAPIGNMDLLIAAHALGTNCTLVTNNQREFKRVPRLKTANWI